MKYRTVTFIAVSADLEEEQNTDYPIILVPR